MTPAMSRWSLSWRRSFSRSFMDGPRLSWLRRAELARLHPVGGDGRRNERQHGAHAELGARLDQQPPAIVAGPQIEDRQPLDVAHRLLERFEIAQRAAFDQLVVEAKVDGIAAGLRVVHRHHLESVR